MTRRQRLLMCPPDHFGVDYVINPWMQHQLGHVDGTRAMAQWRNLRSLLELGAEVETLEPQPRLPDMVFTANAGLEIDGTVVLSRFRMQERRAEEGHFRAYFEGQGFAVAPWPEEVAFEGAGDALRDDARNMIWCGYGWRSGETAAALLEKIFLRRVTALRLVDPRFYHLDTCFCPLASGAVLYYPAAFDEVSRAAIEVAVAPNLRIEVDEADALRFACNAVETCGRLVLNDASDELRRRLLKAGVAPMATALDEFIKSGGSAKCLTLCLSRPNVSETVVTGL